ncbi:hypothetical protein ACS0TY_006677 [Phlomoides rotata]
MEVRVHRLKTYSDAVEMARLRNDHLNVLKRNPRPKVRKGSSTTFEYNAGCEGGFKGPMQTQREKGMCSNCDEKFTPGHK